MSLTTCSKEHCWAASLDNGWCNRHMDERIAELTEALEKESFYARKQKALRVDALARIAELTAAAQAVVDEKARLSIHMGGPVSIDKLNKRISALATLVEVKDE